MSGATSVLHVPYTWFPDECGGTEIYVAGLVTALRRHGIEGVVAAPANRADTSQHDGITAFRFRTSAQPSLAHAYGAPDEIAAASFAEIVDRLRPAIVHVHARSSAVSESLVAAARAAGAKLFFTYHTPTVTCVRGTMMLMGHQPCDGVLRPTRCTTCALQSHGIPQWAGAVLQGIPWQLVDKITAAGLRGRLATGLQISRLTEQSHTQFHSFIHQFDCIVGVCQWADDVLAANGVPKSRRVLCRQGYAGPSAILPRTESGVSRESRPPLRIAYFGRLDPMKGIDIVVEALQRIPNAPIQLDVFAIDQPGQGAYASRIGNAADGRTVFRNKLPADAVVAEMASYDLIAVPSRCLETGPLVVYEAFAAGVPVLGTRLGGIAELVSDGVDGVLIEDSNPANWADAISILAQDSGRLAQLRRGVRPPRSMDQVAAEMARHYDRVLHA